VNKFTKQTCLTVKHQRFIFKVYRPNSSEHLSHHMRVRLYQRINCWNNTASRLFLKN